MVEGVPRVHPRPSCRALATDTDPYLSGGAFVSAWHRGQSAQRGCMPVRGGND